MDFKDYVSRNKDGIYSKIMEYLPVKDPKDHYRIVREYSERRGNYRRPGLLMLCGELFGSSAQDLILPAAAMQLSEDWILIHDDVEDNSELRRGKPALHRIYGNEIAINAGDAVHIAMWKMLKDYMVQSRQGSKLFDKFYNMLEYTVAGQYIETNFVFNTRSMKSATEDLYLRIIDSKTCYYSVYGPMQLGAIAAGQGNDILGLLKKIGEPAGKAFQIIDDVLDMTADEKEFGKKRYGDLYEGKLTLIMLQTYKNATEREKVLIDSIYGKRREEKTLQDINTLVELVDKYGCIDYARSVAEKHGIAAMNEIKKSEKVLPSNEYVQTLLSAIEELYTREK
ncbi:MAG: polyprenyl synthetase family protein [Candidatus Marsarchaeota archaeon]|nr:polyprenyl synthetase family protein [Candidatus Marsarchaeota archaeon]MCL5413542.1 polyprenyl synthetase family protein [Candidatus Marsarchaeota archaeon]